MKTLLFSLGDNKEAPWYLSHLMQGAHPPHAPLTAFAEHHLHFLLPLLEPANSMVVATLTTT